VVFIVGNAVFDVEGEMARVLNFYLGFRCAAEILAKALAQSLPYR
jgi:hypothetical protein